MEVVYWSAVVKDIGYAFAYQKILQTDDIKNNFEYVVKNKLYIWLFGTGLGMGIFMKVVFNNYLQFFLVFMEEFMTYKELMVNTSTHY